MTKNKVYRIGKRLNIFRNIFIVAATFVVITFYVIYDFLIKDSMPALRGLPLFAIFLLAEAVMIFAAKGWCDRVRSLTSYELTDKTLEITRGTNHESLAWKDFENAFYGQVDFTGACPVTYTVAGKSFRPSPYLDGVWELNREIVQRIRPYADIEEDLEKKINAFI